MKEEKELTPDDPEWTEQDPFEYEKEEALPSPKVTKSIIMKREVITENKLYKYRSELPHGVLLKEKKRQFCNALLSLYSTLRPKLKRHKEKEWNELIKSYDKYVFDFSSFCSLNMEELVSFRFKLSEFIEKIGITKIEIKTQFGDILRGSY